MLPASRGFLARQETGIKLFPKSVNKLGPKPKQADGKQENWDRV